MGHRRAHRRARAPQEAEERAARVAAAAEAAAAEAEAEQAAAEKAEEEAAAAAQAEADAAAAKEAEAAAERQRRVARQSVIETKRLSVKAQLEKRKSFQRAREGPGGAPSHAGPSGTALEP